MSLHFYRPRAYGQDVALTELSAGLQLHAGPICGEIPAPLITPSSWSRLLQQEEYSRFAKRLLPKRHGVGPAEDGGGRRDQAAHRLSAIRLTPTAHPSGVNT